MFYIIIRGPAGVGKSSIAKELAKKLNAKYISFDEIMNKNNLDIIEGEGISTKNFIKANELVLKKAEENLKKGKIVAFDGCFYREEQIKHLLKELKYKNFIFTLKASVDTCISRNKLRTEKMSKSAIKEVYKLVERIDYGTIIQTEGKQKEEIIKEILGRISL